MIKDSLQNRTTKAPSAKQIFQVQDLLGTLKHGLEMNFPSVWVEGEISNFIAARSGHWYFSLKDDRAQIRCACFRNRNSRLNLPTEGQRVLLRAQPTIYTQRGELQLIVEDVQDAGQGALHQAFERLKQQLQSEGLFDAALKKPLPAAPRRIGVITSADGAAWHDIHSTLARRFPFGQVRLYPSPVQGHGAAESLIRQLRCAHADEDCDVLIIGRGGGSLEDLQAFNDENLAREIAGATIPIVSAVGHEVDFAISDFISDARAATPTAAAELLSPDIAAWEQRRAQLTRSLNLRTQQTLARLYERLRHRQATLNASSPQRRLQNRAQWLDDLRERLQRQRARQLQQARQRLLQAQMRLQRESPDQLLNTLLQRNANLRQRQQQAIQLALRNSRNQLEHARARLNDLSPDAVLQRGYSITRHKGQILRQPDVDVGEALEIQLATGNINATVSE